MARKPPNRAARRAGNSLPASTNQVDQVQPEQSQPQAGRTTITHSTTTMSQWKAPLPPPETLEHFNDIVPNGAERIFQQWEGETKHRQELERGELRIFGWNALLGRIFAFLFVLLAMGVIVYAIYMNAQWLAGILGVGLIGSVVTAFIRTHRDPPPPAAGPPAKKG